jgi:hypothetical protein
MDGYIDLDIRSHIGEVWTGTLTDSGMIQYNPLDVYHPLI